MNSYAQNVTQMLDSNQDPWNLTLMCTDYNIEIWTDLLCLLKLIKCLLKTVLRVHLKPPVKNQFLYFQAKSTLFTVIFAVFQILALLW